MSLDERVSRWRRLAIGNTAAAAVVVAVAWVFLSPVLAGVVTVVMALAVADIW
jgi:hypothetical protein